MTEFNIARVKIRPFRYPDTDPLIHIAKLSFAEEMSARGMSHEDFIGQVRSVARGRMIPFRLLTHLSGIQWGFFVAEVEGKVVGCGGYLGQNELELANLMVHPDYRRRGIGQALLVERLEYLVGQGCDYVTTTVLSTNQASLGNLGKQNFEQFDRYSNLEISLPLPIVQPAGEVHRNLRTRPVQPADKTRFQTLEKQTGEPELLHIEGSRWSDYAPPSRANRLMNKLWGGRRWRRAFELEGTVIGFISARTSNNSAAGVIMRPVVPDEHLDLLPAMLAEAASWLDGLGKESVQIAVPETRPALRENLAGTRWQKKHTWVRLVKWLAGDKRHAETEQPLTASSLRR